MMVPQSHDLSKLRSSLFASREPRQVRLEPTPVPAGLPAPVPGRQGDVYIANPGESDPRVDSTVRAVDLKTGQQRWTAALKDGLVVAPVPSKDGQTVWASGEAVVSAFSASTGEGQGTWAPGTGDCLRPVPLEGNRAVVGNWNGNRLVALDPGRPQPLWEAEVGPTYGVPAVGAGQVYASVYNGGQIDAGGVIQALDASTGQPVWRYESKSPMRESPAVGPDGAVYVSQDNSSVVALDPQTGQERWQAPVTGRPMTPTVSQDGEHVYVGSLEGALEALDADTGQQVWKLEALGPITRPPAVGPNGTLCVLSEDGRISLVDGDRGTITAEASLEGRPAAGPISLQDGSFLVCNGSGQMSRVPSPATEQAPGAGQAREIQVREAEVSIGGVTLPRR